LTSESDAVLRNVTRQVGPRLILRLPREGLVGQDPEENEEAGDSQNQTTHSAPPRPVEEEAAADRGPSGARAGWPALEHHVEAPGSGQGRRRALGARKVGRIRAQLELILDARDPGHRSDTTNHTTDLVTRYHTAQEDIAAFAMDLDEPGIAHERTEPGADAFLQNVIRNIHRGEPAQEPGPQAAAAVPSVAQDRSGGVLHLAAGVPYLIARERATASALDWIEDVHEPSARDGTDD
jgi:hypothetical protein